MATTKIWDVRAHVSKLLAYVAKTSKTTVEVGVGDPAMKLAAEMLGLPPEHFATEEKKFVSGINCTPENANDVMLTLLEDTDKDDIQAYHGYQSFKPGEVTPDVAHAIGVQLANELWGEDFPVVVATHIDRGHVHNHFCLSATGFSGKRYHDCKATYKLMRETSDRLCREYGLSVIEKPKQKGTKHIAEVHAEKKGIPTIRDQIRADIDAVANYEYIIKYFYNRMRTLGYTFERRGQYLRIKPYGYNKFFRLDKLGAGYTEADIETRIKQNAREMKWIPIQYYTPTLQEKPKGLRALYLHYLYLLGAIPKVIPKNPEAYAAIKDDIRRARMYSEQAKFLGKYGLETKDDLIQHALKIDPQIKALCKERRALWNKIRSLSQSIRMKRLSQEGKLDMDTIFDIMTEEKPNQKETVKIQREKLDRYFGRGVPVAKIEATILNLLEQERIRQLKKRSEREDR